MGMGVKLPWVGGQNTMVRGQNTKGRVQNNMGSGSIYHGQGVIIPFLFITKQNYVIIRFKEFVLILSLRILNVK
jgi:hypothetical protein